MSVSMKSGKKKCGGQMSERTRLHIPMHFMYSIQHEGTCSRPNRVFSIRYNTRTSYSIRAYARPRRGVMIGCRFPISRGGGGGG